MRRSRVTWLLLPWAAVSANAFAQPAPLYDGTDGATCDYFNLGARIAWHHRQGDWRDANGVAQGDTPFATARVRSADVGRAVSFDITRLAAGWLAGAYPNAGIVVNRMPENPDGAAVFHSRETNDTGLGPALVVETAGGATRRLAAIADTTIDCTTVYSIGSQESLTTGAEKRFVVQFDLKALAGTRIARATLELTAAKRQYGDSTVGVFRVDPPYISVAGSTKPRPGLAARYPHDRGIERDPDVLMAAGFESATWWKRFSFLGLRGSYERVSDDPALGFQALDGAALKVKIPAGGNLGLDLRYKFERLDRAPDEIYFRYYLRLANDWQPSIEGGKLPGISGTYGQAGWGGRKTDGATGWSLRGSFYRMPEPGNPYHGLTPIGTYAYHADMEDFWGDPWYWSGSGDALLERNRWYCIEQYLKINRPGVKDAVFRSWVDGKLVFEKTGFRLRDVPSIGIEEVWMNVYYGGQTPSPRDQHVFIDNVVIARNYIGPMAQ